MGERTHADQYRVEILVEQVSHQCGLFRLALKSSLLLHSAIRKNKKHQYALFAL